MSSDPRADLLALAAEHALERLKARRHETAEQWAAKLAPTFFADLEHSDQAADLEQQEKQT